MNPTRRALVGPITFVFAIIAAVGMFFIAVTQGLALALAFAVMVATLYTAFNSDDGGVYCLIVAALLEGLYKSLSPNMVTMLVKDIFLTILLLRLFWVSQRQRDFSWLHQPFTSAAVCFTAYCIALMFAPTTRSLLLALAGLRAWVLWMPAYFPFYAYFSDLNRVTRFLRVLIYLMLPVSLYGILQGNIGYAHTAVLPNFHKLSQFYQSDYNPNAEQNAGEGSAQFESSFNPIMNVRACAIHISPGAFGAMCAVMVLMSVGYAGYTPSGAMRVWAIVSGLAAAGGLLASGSRAPMLGLVAGMIAMTVVARRRGALIAGLGLIALVSVLFLRDVTGGGALRFEKRLSTEIVFERAMYPLQVGIKQGLEHPFGNGIATGIGMGRVFYGAGLETAEGVRWVENEFGRALGELGFFGCALWLFMICSILWHCARSIRNVGDASEGFLMAGMFGGMVSVFVQLSVGSALYGAHGGMYYWIFAAAIMKTADHVLAARRQAAAAPEGASAEQEAALPPTGTLGPEPGPPSWRQPGRWRGHRPPGPSRLVLKPPQPGQYRRAPGAPPGPRPGAPKSEPPDGS